MSVPVRLRTQVARLIPRLASKHDGEVVATARAIARCLASAGFDFHSLAAAVDHVQLAAHRQETSDLDWRDVAEWCAEHSDRLREHDRDFVHQMTDWHEPSEKQLDWLRIIAERLRRGGAS